METRKGVTAIIYDKRGSIVHFLILNRNTNWKGWEFVKGKMEPGEEPKETLIREVREETGLKKFDIKARLTTKREFEHNDILYSFDVYLVEANMNVPVITDPSEHDNYLWANKDRVLDKLYWPDAKDLFVEALNIIQNAEL